MIRFPCPSCGEPIKAPDEAAGKAGKCKCGEVVRVPTPNPFEQAIEGRRLPNGVPPRAENWSPPAPSPTIPGVPPAVRTPSAPPTRATILGVFAFFGGYFSQFWEHAGRDFQPEVLLIPEAVRPPLDGTDLVVDAFHETQRHLVLRAAIGLDPVPVRCHHAGEGSKGSRRCQRNAARHWSKKRRAQPGLQ